jgi:hypothetical protein
LSTRSVDITLDKPRRIRFDVNALDTLDQALGGMPLMEMIRLLSQGSVRASKLALWVGLRHEDRNLTPDRVGNMMQEHLDDGGELGELNDKVMEALYGSGIIRRPEEPAPQDPTPPSPTPTSATSPIDSATG